MLSGNKQERHRSRAANLKVFRKMKGKAANCYVLLRMIWEIKVSSDWFGCVLAISFYAAKLFSESG